MATFKGFAPSFYYPQNGAGLAIYVAPGLVNGAEVNGAAITVPANSTTQVYVTNGGQIAAGASVPVGAYPIATIVSGTVITGGNTVAGLKGPLGPWAGLTTDNGILSITDIRT